MKKIDLRFKNDTIELLKSLVGKKMDFYQYVPPGVFFKINGDWYLLIHNCNDVGAFQFEKINTADIKKINTSDAGGLSERNLTIAIGKTIAEIRITNENQQLFHHNIQTYDVDTVKELAFVLQDGQEMSFENFVLQDGQEMSFENFVLQDGQEMSFENRFSDDCEELT